MSSRSSESSDLRDIGVRWGYGDIYLAACVTLFLPVSVGCRGRKEAKEASRCDVSAREGSCVVETKRNGSRSIKEGEKGDVEFAGEWSNDTS